MINGILIEQLFGRFNYSISIAPGGITILTGPNGFGKSTILRIISAISNGNLSFFIKLDFSSITILFEGNDKIVIKKSQKFLYLDDLRLPEITDHQMDFFQYGRRNTWLVRTPNGYYDRRTGDSLTEDEYYYLSVFGDDEIWERFLTKEQRETLKRIKKKLEKVRSLCGDVRLISDQRLIRTQNRREEVQVIDVISELPQKLKDEINRVVAEYSQVSTKLDSSYPKRLFSAKDGINNQQEYSERLEEANKRFEKLNEYNLVDMSLIDNEEYNQTYSTALKIYFDDFSKKYIVFEGLIEKLDLFTKIINDRLSFKQLRISRDNGFEVVDIDNTSKTLDLSQLSSGEKQEIVLFYDLIFRTKLDLLLLIDEPEISLHITWQKKFLDDLIEISKQNKLQAIVATHSPQIISNHLDIQIDLGGLYNAELNKR